jgi:hypothetical protein
MISAEERRDAEGVAGLPRLSDQEVRNLALEIERTGFAVLPNYLAPEALEALQTFVRQAVAKAGGEYAGIDAKDVARTLLAKLPEAAEFAGLLRRLYEHGTGRAAPDQGIYRVLRCLTGRTALKQCFIFHYDSYVVTLLLPILIPTGGRRGDLIMAPRRRTIRPSYELNLLDKLLIDNKLTQFILRRLLLSGVLKVRRVEMVPGNLYMFWGYRTLHANEPCDPTDIRSTALFHFGDPHGESWLRRRLGRVAV